MKEGFSIIYSGIEGLKYSEREIKAKLGDYEQAINDLREVVARKANYSDYLSQIERKANKDDFTDLRQEIASMDEERSRLISTNLKPNTSNIERRMKRSRRNSIHKFNTKDIQDFSPQGNILFHISQTEQALKSKELTPFQKRVQMKTYSTRLHPAH